jgi:hypothetical protein
MEFRIPSSANRKTRVVGHKRTRLFTIAGSVGILSLALALASCRSSPRQPVTVTVLDPEWSQPDELPAAEQASQAFTRETGILVKHLPVPETSLSQLAGCGKKRKCCNEAACDASHRA